METPAKNKGLYRFAKGFLSFFILFSAYYSYSHAADLRLLGFPDYFRIELVIAKITGGLVLLIPGISPRIKDWVYVGFLIAMGSALIAHIATHDAVSKIIFVLVDLVLVLLCMRYVSKQDRLTAFILTPKTNQP